MTAWSAATVALHTILYIACFVIGIALGRRIVSTPALITLIAVIVAVVWAVVALVDLVMNDYRALTIATPVMLLVVGTVLGLKRNGARH